MNIGLYFGSFNPIHVGHLIIANHLAQQKDLDQIWLVISPQNPLKSNDGMLQDFHRFNLVKIAIEDNPKLKASDIEFSLSKPSYTVNTLAHLKEKYPEYSFSLILGEDNLRNFHKWYNFEYILENHKIYVYPRNATTEEQKNLVTNENQLLIQHRNIKICENTPLMQISSSFIRQQIKLNKDVRYLLSEPVFNYVDEMNFYR